MEEKFFLVQIKHDGENWDKGVVIKDSLDAALQGFHAYFGAYGYGQKETVDYVQCMVVTIDGLVVKNEIYRKAVPIPEPVVEETEEPNA